MPITKSTRHQKIIGAFGEMLVCNWLSRSGFEVTLVDHTGIDIIAYKPRTGRLGITVKSRTRSRGEREAVNILANKKADRQKLLEACKAFGCKPWIAIYVEKQEAADLYLTSLKNYDAKYRGDGSKRIDDWKMTPAHVRRYKMDPHVKRIGIRFDVAHWWG